MRENVTTQPGDALIVFGLCLAAPTAIHCSTGVLINPLLLY